MPYLADITSPMARGTPFRRTVSSKRPCAVLDVEWPGSACAAHPGAVLGFSVKLKPPPNRPAISDHQFSALGPLGPNCPLWWGLGTDPVSSSRSTDQQKEGVDGHSDEPAYHRPVDPDELEVAAQLKLEPV